MAKKRRRLPWPLALVSRIIIVSAAAALAFSYLSIYINPAKFTLPLFFGLYFIPLVLINLLILIVGISKKSGAVWITFIALLPSILFAELFVRWGDPAKGEEGISLKVCTYNVGLFSQNKNDTPPGQGIASFLEEENAGVVCLQEFRISDTSKIQKMFPSYPYYHYHLFNGKEMGYFGNLTLSRFPIVHSGKITFSRSTNLCIFTDIVHYGKTLRFYNTHLESHSISFTSIIKKIREKEKISDEIFNVHDKVAGTFKRRSLQADTIVHHAGNSGLPSVICGDFNDTPMSYTYKNLVSERKDSFRESGNGFSATYSLLWPLLRIDYILYPPQFWSMSHNSPKIGFSDHYPVISELIIP
jgi:endonuclease/exonuclease/phosphatase family metal-dependent hydrolase